MPCDTMTLEDATKLARELRPEDFQPPDKLLNYISADEMRRLCDFILSDAMKREIENAAYELAAQLAQDCFPPAHTYASENGDLYAAQDSASRIIANAIRSLITPAKTADTEG